VVFSDEKIWRFRPGGSPGVWRRRGNRFKYENTIKTTAKSQGLMIWAAINGAGDILLKKCPKKMKADGYQDILIDSLEFIKGARCDRTPLPA
jgi:hypothetical protein